MTATPYLVTIPWGVSSVDGWDFLITDVSIRDDLQELVPVNDYFLVILFDVSNNTGRLNCLKSEQFAVTSGMVTITMDKKQLDTAKAKFARDYPGTFVGQCIKNETTAQSLLVFDIPNTKEDYYLELRDQKIRLGMISTILKGYQ